MNWAPKSSFLIILRGGVLSMTHMHGLAPFPWPIPWTGLPFLRTLPYDEFEIPYPDLTWRCMFWRLRSIDSIGPVGSPTR